MPSFESTPNPSSAYDSKEEGSKVSSFYEKIVKQENIDA